jgi:uncharacterized protein YndB with AHSA1/START domain
MAAASSKTDTGYELVITRTFDAPRKLVWRAWNDRDLARQWGPRGFTTPEREMDLRPGGLWRALMIAPDGTPYRQHGVVQEVTPPERLAFTFIWDDDPELEMLVTVTFAEKNGKTEMIFRQTGLPSTDSRDGHRGGWTEAFDRLEEVVAAL